MLLFASSRDQNSDTPTTHAYRSDFAPTKQKAFARYTNEHRSQFLQDIQMNTNSLSSALLQVTPTHIQWNQAPHTPHASQFLAVKWPHDPAEQVGTTPIEWRTYYYVSNKLCMDENVGNYSVVYKQVRHSATLA